MRQLILPTSANLNLRGGQFVHQVISQFIVRKVLTRLQDERQESSCLLWFSGHNQCVLLARWATSSTLVILKNQECRN